MLTRSAGLGPHPTLRLDYEYEYEYRTVLITRFGRAETYYAVYFVFSTFLLFQIL